MVVDHPEWGMQPGGSLGKERWWDQRKEDVMMEAEATVMQLEGREKGQEPRHWRARRLLPGACRKKHPGWRLGFGRVRPFGLLLHRNHRGLCGFSCGAGDLL